MRKTLVVWKHFLKFARRELHQHPVLKFLLALFLLSAYTVFAGYKFGAKEGILVSALTWSFFVLCTPIADAGFLLDLPFRLLTGIRMMFSEMAVWAIAISLNVVVTLFTPQVYGDTVILSLLSHIIHEPFPFWGIILLSAMGTFLSIVFGDEILDVALEKKKERHYHLRHKHKHHFLIMIFLVILAFILYDFLLKSGGITLP